MTCECKNCCFVRKQELPMWTFGERPPRVGDHIFLDTPSNIFRRHKASHLILSIDEHEDEWKMFKYFTQTIQYMDGKDSRSPLNLKVTDSYWLLGSVD